MLVAITFFWGFYPFEEKGANKYSMMFGGKNVNIYFSISILCSKVEHNIWHLKDIESFCSVLKIYSLHINREGRGARTFIIKKQLFWSHIQEFTMFTRKYIRARAHLAQYLHAY